MVIVLLLLRKDFSVDHDHMLFKVSAYKMGVSMRLFKLQVLSLFKLPFSISGENWSLNEHLRAKFGLK